MNILCRIGIHRWKPYKVDGSIWGLVALVCCDIAEGRFQPPKMVCSRCGKRKSANPIDASLAT